MKYCTLPKMAAGEWQKIEKAGARIRESGKNALHYSLFAHCYLWLLLPQHNLFISNLSKSFPLILSGSNETSFSFSSACFLSKPPHIFVGIGTKPPRWPLSELPACRQLPPAGWLEWCRLSYMLMVPAGTHPHANIADILQ